MSFDFRTFGILAFLVLTLSQLSFADIAAPPHSQVTVFMLNHNAPDASIAQIEFHCANGTNFTGFGGPSEMVIIPCSNGVCSNNGSEWFIGPTYCYRNLDGYFTYQYNNTQINTANITFNGSYDMYDVAIDAPTGTIFSKSARDTPDNNFPTGCCATVFILPIVVIGAITNRRK